MVDVISPEYVQVRYGIEDTYGDGDYQPGCPGHNPAFLWIGIIEEATNPYDNSMRECRGIGDIDLSALATGMKNPEITLKWIIQRYWVNGTGFNPKTFLDYAITPPVGITIGYEATYGSSFLSLWYKGMMIDSLDIDFGIDDFIRATMKLVGQDVVVDDALIDAESRESNPLDAANGYALPLTGQDATVYLNAAGGEDAPIANVKKVHIFIKNNYVKIPVVRSSDSDLLKYILRGRRELGGELTLFVETKDELDMLVGSTLLDLKILLHNSDTIPGFDFTNVKFDTGQFSTKVNEIPCELSLPFKAASVTSTSLE